MSVGPARRQSRDRGVNWDSRQGLSLRPTRERREEGLSRTLSVDIPSSVRQQAPGRIRGRMVS